MYTRNFGKDNFVLGDVARINAASLPRPVKMAWSSFPCQDLSLAGWRNGITAKHSGVFWAFWRLMHDLARERPPMIVVENVTGLLYGDSFTGLCEAIAALGMQFGALVMDASQFLPQSRSRVFLVALDERVDCSSLVSMQPVPNWAPKALLKAYERLTGSVRALWRWWWLPLPEEPRPSIAGMIEEEPTLVDWNTSEQTQRLLDMMSDSNKEKVQKAVRARHRQIGFLYKRIRNDRQRAEVRFDGVAGCLRTPQGGSSRQTVVVIEDGSVRTRLLSPREAARLMGVPDSFALPDHYNNAYKAMGDAVAVPVVSWLSEKLLLPMAMLLPDGSRAMPLAKNHSQFHARAERRALQWMNLQTQRSAPVQQS